MQCIFCKQESSASKTNEHIIPEALGTKEHALPPPVVYDKCNNYFVLKIEEPLLSSGHFRQARFRNFISKKEDRIPTIQGILLPGILPIEMSRDKKSQGIFPAREIYLNQFIKSLKSLSDWLEKWVATIEGIMNVTHAYLNRASFQEILNG